MQQLIHNVFSLYLTCQDHWRRCCHQTDLLESETKGHMLGLLAKPVNVTNMHMLVYNKSANHVSSYKQLYGRCFYENYIGCL